MLARWIFSSLVLTAGCGLIGSGTTSLGGSSKSATRSASKARDDAEDAAPAAKSAKSAKPRSGSSVAVGDDDPPHVARAIERLDKMEQLIADKKFSEYARESRDFNGTFLFHDGWSGEAKRDAMRKRLDELDAAAFEAFGGRIGPLVGDAKRVTKLDDDAVEAADQVVDACQSAAKMSTTGQGEAAAKLAAAVAAYEKQLARAQKIEPQVFHYYGEAKRSGTIDVSTKLMECEVSLVAVGSQFEDEYAPEVAGKSETEKGCGSQVFIIDGVQIGGGRFAPYSRTEGGAQFVEQVPCKKLAKKNNYPKAMAAAVKEYADREGFKLADIKVTLRGKPYIEQDDDDFRLHRYQELTVYSKKFEFSKNPCGDGKTFCEGGGSRGAAAFNRLEHALERAAVHAGGNPDRCKEHLKAAKSQADWFAQFHADMVKSGDWISGATYKTKKGQKLKEKEFIAAFDDKGKQAEQMLDDRFCSKKK